MECSVHGEEMTLYRIAVTGHRDLGDEKTVQFVQDTFHIILMQTQHNHPAGVVALSGLAEGSDTLFRGACLKTYGGNHYAKLPFSFPTPG